MNIDPERAARAAAALSDGDVQIKPTGRPCVWEVTSFTGDRTYRVRLNGRRSCSCPDALYNGTDVCKHIVAVALATAGQPT